MDLDTHNELALRQLYANIGKLITSSLELEEILTGIMDEVEQFFHPNNWSLLRYDPVSEELFFVIVEGIDKTAVEHIRLKSGQGIAGRAAAEKRTIFIPDTAGNSDFQNSVDKASGFRTRSVLAAPLVFRDEVYGVIELINYHDNHEFSDEEVLILETIADFAAIAFANARLYEDALSRAVTDPLTGVQNRTSLEQMLDQWEQETGSGRRREDRDREFVTIAVIDLDNFKLINDTLGHKAGDRVLVEVAAALRRTLRSSDLVYRIGGDEFMALVEVSDATILDVVENRLRRKLDDMSSLDIGDLGSVELSWGIASGSREEAREVMHRADLHMYQCKKKRRR